MRKRIPRYVHAPLIMCAVTQFLAYMCTKPGPDADFVNIALPVDYEIPLKVIWVLPYVGAYVYWIWGYVAICSMSRRHCRELICADIAGKLVAAVCFLCMPTTLERYTIEGRGLCQWMLGIIYALDTPYNLFPSLHCFFSWLIFRRLMAERAVKPYWKAAAGIFSILVFFSTLFTRQHYLLDVFAGVALAEAANAVCVPMARLWTHIIEKRGVVNEKDD